MKRLSSIIFGTSCFGNLYKSIPMETKVAIAAEWFKAFEHPVIDSAGKYGAGLSLECIGKALKALGKKNGDLTISVKLGWRKADPEKDAAAFAFPLVLPCAVQPLRTRSRRACGGIRLSPRV